MMRNRMTTTGMLVITTCIVWGIYDAIVIHLHGIEASISVFLQDTMLDSPIVSFSIGAIFGHLLAPIQPRKGSHESSNSVQFNRE